MIFKFYVHTYQPIEIKDNKRIFDYEQIINSPEIDNFIIQYLSIIEYDD
jgi:hypothetical protein